MISSPIIFRIIPNIILILLLVEGVECIWSFSIVIFHILYLSSKKVHEEGPVKHLWWKFCLSVCLPACLSVCLSVRPSVRLSLCLYLWMLCLFSQNVKTEFLSNVANGLMVLCISIMSVCRFLWWAKFFLYLPSINWKLLRRSLLVNLKDSFV